MWLLVASWIFEDLWEYRQRIPGHGWNAVWEWFRTHYGLIWSLRLQERFRRDMQRLGAPWRLSWTGLVRIAESALPEQPDAPSASSTSDGPELPDAAGQALRNAFARFVDPDWLETRLSLSPPETAASETRASYRPD